MPAKVDPEPEEVVNRWAAVRKASPKRVISQTLLLDILRIISAVTNNSVMRYKLNKSIEELDASEKEFILRNVVNRLDHEEFSLLISFLTDEKKTNHIIKSRPKMLHGSDTILGIDYKGLSKEPLDKLLNSFRLVLTNFTGIPSTGKIQTVSIADLPQTFGEIKLEGGLSLNDFLEIVVKWSANNANANVYLTDPGLSRIVCKTQDGQEWSIIDYIRRYLQPHNPELASIRFIAEKDFLARRLDNTIADEQAALNLLHNQDDFYAGKDINEIRKFYAPVEVDDAALTVAYQESLDSATDLGDFLPHASHPLIFDFSAPRPAIDTTIESAIAPALGAVGVYQASYAIAANKSIFRNVFNEYRTCIDNLTNQEIANIFAKYKDPLDQIEQIRLKARENMLESMLRETFFSGCTGSVFFGSILALVLGPFAPFALIPTGIGVIIGGLAALRNKYLLGKKLDTFLHNDQIEHLIVEKLNSYKRQEQTASPDVKEKYLHRFSFLTTMVTYATRLVGMGTFAIISISPIIFSAAASLHAMISWSLTKDHLKKMRDNPLAALYAAKNVDIDQISITAHRSLRNEFMKYLFEVKGADAIEMMLLEAGVKIPTTTDKLEDNLRYILSRVGLCETTRTNNILNALTDPSSTKALALYDKLHNECKQMSFNQGLAAHLEKYGAKLGLSEKSLHVLQEARNQQDYNKLYIDYLKESSINNTAKIVNITGFGSTITAAVIFVALAVTFSPIGPFALAAIVPMLALGYVISKSVAYYEKKRMRKALENVTEAELNQIIQTKGIPSHLPVTKKIYKTATPEVALEKQTAETTPSFRTRLPAHYKLPTHYKKNLQKSLRHLCNGASTPLVSSKYGQQFVVKKERGGIIDIYLLSQAETAESSGAHNKIVTVNAPTKNKQGEATQEVNLHQGTAIGWQIFLLTLIELQKNSCSFSFGENLSDHLSEQRAMAFLQAMLAEFESPQCITCRPLQIEFADHETALAVYKILQQKEFVYNEVSFTKESLDKLRVHFGLELIDGELLQKHHHIKGELTTFINHEPPLQNTNIFTAHMQFITNNLGPQQSQQLQMH